LITVVNVLSHSKALEPWNPGTLESFSPEIDQAGNGKVSNIIIYKT
jgi:hypothetical protein